MRYTLFSTVIVLSCYRVRDRRDLANEGEEALDDGAHRDDTLRDVDADEARVLKASRRAGAAAALTRPRAREAVHVAECLGEEAVLAVLVVDEELDDADKVGEAYGIAGDEREAAGDALDVEDELHRRLERGPAAGASHSLVELLERQREVAEEDVQHPGRVDAHLQDGRADERAELAAHEPRQHGALLSGGELRVHHVVRVVAELRALAELLHERAGRFDGAGEDDGGASLALGLVPIPP
jgi:hypothetical protein